MTDREMKKLKDSLPQWDKQNEEEKKLDRELACRDMINSILIYGYLNSTVDEIYENKYLRNYKKDISEGRIKELIKEQQDDLKKSKINSDVYTDGEGVSYNSVTWYDEDVKEESLFNKSKNISNTDISNLNTNLMANNEMMLNKLQPKLNESLGDRYEVWQRYFEDGLLSKEEYVMSFATFEEANKFVEGLNEDSNCEAWVVDTELNESKESNLDNQYYIDRLNELKNQYKSGYGKEDEDIKQEVIRLLNEIPNGFEAYRVSKETNSGWTAYGSYHDEYTVLVLFRKINNIWEYNNRKKDDTNDAMLSVLYNSGDFMTKEEAEAKKKEQEKDDKSYHRDIVNVGTDQWGNPMGKSTNRIDYPNRKEESKELRKYNSRLYGVYDTEKESYEEVGSLEDMRDKVENEKEDVKEKQEEPKEDNKDININITVKNEGKYSEKLYVYTDANTYDRDELNGNVYNYKQEAPNLNFKVFQDKGMYFVQFIGTKQDIIDYLTKLGWYSKDEIEELDLIQPYKDNLSDKEIKTESLEEESVKPIINPEDKFYKDDHLWVVYLYPGAGVEMIPYYLYADYEQDALEILISYLLDNAPGLVYDIQELEEEFLDDYITVDGIHYLDYNTKVEELFGNEKDKIETEFFKNYKEEE